MSVATISNLVQQSDSPHHPFECTLCGRRFTRHENLKRHLQLHSNTSEGNSFPCEHCQRSFSRPDLRNRHVKQKHPEEHQVRPPKRRYISTDDIRSSDEGNSAIAGTIAARSSLSSQSGVPITTGSLAQTTGFGHGFPRPEAGSWSTDASNIGNNISQWDTNCATNPFLASNVPTPTSGRRQDERSDSQSDFEPSSFESAGWHGSALSPSINSPQTPDSYGTYLPDGLSAKDAPLLHDEWLPTHTQYTQGFAAYFRYATSFIPFLHRPTFDAGILQPHLALSMLSIAYQYTEDPESDRRTGSGAELAFRCFHRARIMTAVAEDEAADPEQKLAIVQSYWLLEISALFYICGETSALGFKMHSRMISFARSSGMMQPTPGDAPSDDLESLWRQFVRTEAQKRTIFAVHQIDALCYQIFSIPRSLSHLEIKYDLPARERDWMAVSATQWAFGRLATPPASSVSYIDTVRQFVSQETHVGPLPDVDLFGAINVAQFLLSSAREVSGWSTMTGMLSLDRFEPLHNSLQMLGEHCLTQTGQRDPTHLITFESVWRMAMIELNMWSTSHTSGIIEGSIDAVLKQATISAKSTPTGLSDQTIATIMPHVEWFLVHLSKPDSTTQFGPPWLAFCAYKAFLIAWQLYHSVHQEAFLCIGFPAQDGKGVMAWARLAFVTHAPKRIGQLVLQCLDSLENT